MLLKLPHGMKMRDVRWLSIWCRRFTVNYGDVYLPRGIQIPRPEASLFKALSLTYVGQGIIENGDMGHAIWNYTSRFCNIAVCPYVCISVCVLKVP